MALRYASSPEEEIHERVMNILKLVEMEGMESRMTNQLSGGQQQRVALARALVIEPSVLLFDEPLSNLDAKLRVTMRTEIRKIQQKVGITAIYVTHDQSEAMSISDKIIIMSKGKVEQIGTPGRFTTIPIPGSWRTLSVKPISWRPGSDPQAVRKRSSTWWVRSLR